MVASPRLAQLALLFLYCSSAVHSWSATDFFWGSSEDEIDVDDNDDAIEDKKASAQKRTLSSFESHTTSIPADQPITPRGRRDIEASVISESWPTTIFSPLCEAWAYLEAGASIGKSKSKEDAAASEAKDSLAWSYLDSLVEQGGIPSLDHWIDGAVGEWADWTYQNSTTLAANTASLLTTSTLDTNLLPMALSLRAHSPHCEMHRSLAREAAIAIGFYSPTSVYDVRSGGALNGAFCIVSRVVGKEDENGVKTESVVGKKVISDHSLLSAAINRLKSEDVDMENDIDDEGNRLFMPLSDESYHPATVEKAESDIVAILYGQVGTTDFASLYRSLKDLQIKFVVRHMGHVPHEEELKLKMNNPRATPTVLQGYGVRLDIRNVEYKAFDDGPDDKKDGEAEIDWTEAGHKQDDPARNEYLAGVNLETLLGRLDVAEETPLPTGVQALQTALIQSHPTQLRSESIIPPAWQRRPLSLQAATVIAASPDPLETLQGVSQNLPSVAHSLVNVQVPDSLESLAEEASNLAAKVGAVSPGWGDAAFGLYINSRSVNVERPSFNVFQLLNVIREENMRLHELEMKVRPILQNTLSAVGRKNDDGTSAEWPALQAVRKAFDMGSAKLAQLGKTGFSDEKSVDLNKDVEEEDEEDSSSSSDKYRIDVGRGGKKAILYLNDIEKDPEYKSWPSSMQEMFYRAQYGGAPTVRRNLFTMLVVLDPSSGMDHPALDIVGQLMNSQFPLRLGVLMVNDDDVANGKASPPLPWDNGDRPFNARDCSLLLNHIRSRFGGMAAISSLIQAHQAIASGEVSSAKDYIRIHLALFGQMGIVDSSETQRVETEMESILESGISDAETVTYEDGVQFAADKLIRPGMSFFNGLPLPDASNMEAFGAGINSILQYEQRHIMNLAMKGEITDRAPRSIYASLLKGDKLFNQYHPLLKDSAAVYSVVSPTSDWQSLILPTFSAVDFNNLDSIFLIEGVFDLEKPSGIESALSFLDLANSPPGAWNDSKTISLAFRMLPSEQPSSPRSKVIATIFNLASQFNLGDMKKLIDATTSQDNVAEIIATILKLDGIEADKIRKLADAIESETPIPVAKSTEATAGKTNYYVANGRVYVPIGDARLNESDIKMLVNLEMDKTHAITKLLTPHLLPTDWKGDIEEAKARTIYAAIGTSVSMLNEIMSTSSSKSEDSAATFDSFRNGGENPLYFSWNEEGKSADHLQVEVSVILDPLTEPTQRVAPLLLAIRDVLKLPLRLILAPRKTVSNDVPLSSYYRFVADPSAFPGSNPPKSLFQNLPTNHLLTLRMDVPELWDVQQANTVQDTDNLRCDARFGCGDEAYLLANSGQDDVKPTKSMIESTKIEYTLKSLLFFGQCYDVSHNTPPNGLQLTLDRYKSNSSESEVTTAEVLPDGTQHVKYSGDITQSEHTDTLVMKTAGYWQLRANPGVWSLRIARESGGSEIYKMVDGKLGPSGRVQLKKNTAERTYKPLMMKDFTNQGRLLLVKRRKGFEEASLFRDEADLVEIQEGEKETVHVFSLATGHAYERLLKIMMLSVTKRTSSPVKFWLFENVSFDVDELLLYLLCFVSYKYFLVYGTPSFSLLHSKPQQNTWLKKLDVK